MLKAALGGSVPEGAPAEQPAELDAAAGAGAAATVNLTVVFAPGSQQGAASRAAEPQALVLPARPSSTDLAPKKKSFLDACSARVAAAGKDAELAAVLRNFAPKGRKSWAQIAGSMLRSDRPEAVPGSDKPLTFREYCSHIGMAPDEIFAAPGITSLVEKTSNGSGATGVRPEWKSALNQLKKLEPGSEGIPAVISKFVGESAPAASGADRAQTSAADTADNRKAEGSSGASGDGKGANEAGGAAVASSTAAAAAAQQDPAERDATVQQTTTQAANTSAQGSPAGAEGSQAKAETGDPIAQGASGGDSAATEEAPTSAGADAAKPTGDASRASQSPAADPHAKQRRDLTDRVDGFYQKVGNFFTSHQLRGAEERFEDTRSAVRSAMSSYTQNLKAQITGAASEAALQVLNDDLDLRSRGVKAVLFQNAAGLRLVSDKNQERNPETLISSILTASRSAATPLIGLEEKRLALYQRILGLPEVQANTAFRAVAPGLYPNRELPGSLDKAKAAALRVAVLVEDEGGLNRLQSALERALRLSPGALAANASPGKSPEVPPGAPKEEDGASLSGGGAGVVEPAAVTPAPDELQAPEWVRAAFSAGSVDLGKHGTLSLGSDNALRYEFEKSGSKVVVAITKEYLEECQELAELTAMLRSEIQADEEKLSGSENLAFLMKSPRFRIAELTISEAEKADGCGFDLNCMPGAKISLHAKNALVRIVGENLEVPVLKLGESSTLSLNCQNITVKEYEIGRDVVVQGEVSGRFIRGRNKADMVGTRMQRLAVDNFANDWKGVKFSFANVSDTLFAKNVVREFTEYSEFRKELNAIAFKNLFSDTDKLKRLIASAGLESADPLGLSAGDEAPSFDLIAPALEGSGVSAATHAALEYQLQEITSLGRIGNSVLVVPTDPRFAESGFCYHISPVSAESSNDVVGYARLPLGENSASGLGCDGLQKALAEFLEFHRLDSDKRKKILEQAETDFLASLAAKKAAELSATAAAGAPAGTRPAPRAVAPTRGTGVFVVDPDHEGDIQQDDANSTGESDEPEL